MSIMTDKQIQEMFEDFGLGTENDRNRFRDLEILDQKKIELATFIRLNDSSQPNLGEKENAKLA